MSLVGLRACHHVDSRSAPAEPLSLIRPQEFKRLAALAGVCVMKEQAFWHLDDNIEDAMEYFVRELLIALGSTRFQSLGVVYFGHDNEAAILFQMIQDRGSKWHNQNKVPRSNVCTVLFSFLSF